MDLVSRDDVTGSPVQRIGINNIEMAKAPSRFTRDLEWNEIVDFTSRNDAEGNDKTKRQLSRFLYQTYAGALTSASFDQGITMGATGPVYYAIEVAHAINLQKKSLDLITIADVEELYFRVNSYYAEVGEVQKIFATKYLGEFHFHILLSTKAPEEALMFRLFDLESELHDLFESRFFTFHYLPDSLGDRAQYIQVNAELIFGREDV